MDEGAYSAVWENLSLWGEWIKDGDMMDDVASNPVRSAVHEFPRCSKDRRKVYGL